MGLFDFVGVNGPTRGFTGRFFGTIACEPACEAAGEDIICDVSPSASQADLSKKPTRESPTPAPTGKRCFFLLHLTPIGGFPLCPSWNSPYLPQCGNATRPSACRDCPSRSQATD